MAWTQQSSLMLFRCPVLLAILLVHYCGLGSSGIISGFPLFILKTVGGYFSYKMLYVFSISYLSFIVVLFFFFIVVLYDCISISFLFLAALVFIAARGLSLVAVSEGCSSLRCAGFSLQWLLLLQSTGSRCAGFSSCGTRA